MNAKEYSELLTRYCDLQLKLVQTFESAVEIIPPPPALLDQIPALRGAIRPEYSVSQILRAWPKGVLMYPLVAWVKPRVGVFNLEERKWLFNVHGTWQVNFLGLPLEIGERILESLRQEEMSVLKDIPGCGPNVDMTFFGMGSTHGVTAWQMYLFVKSHDPMTNKLSLSDHESLLDKLFKEGLLVREPDYTPAESYYAFADDFRSV